MAGVEEFRIGTILSKSWEVFQKNLVPIGGCAVVLLALPTILFLGLVMPSLLSGGFASSGAVWKMQLPNLLQMALQLVAMGAITYGAIEALEGRTLAIGDLINRGLSGALPLLGIVLIFILIMIPSVFLLFIPLIILGCMWWVAVPVAIVEKAGVFGALKRSADLTKGVRWQIFGMILIYVAVSMVFGAIAMALLLGGGGGFAAVTQRSLAMLTGGFSAYVIVSQIISAIIFAFICVVVAVTYAELRRIKEGATIKDIANVFN